MSTERDLELGAALRSLPTPEHGPGFWAELEDRLAGEPALPELSRRQARRLAPRGVWLLSAAAVVAMVVAAVALVDRGEGTRVRVTPPATTLERDSWKKLSESPLSARSGHTAVWTGREMLVWGGARTPPEPLADGAAYDPSTDRWEPMADAPSGPLYDATAVWTGKKMLVWGTRLGTAGDPDSDAAAGAAYDPASDTWSSISPSPLRTVAGQVPVWTGERMLVWGGSVGESPVADGAAYDPDTDRWTELAAAPIGPRFDHSAVWGGDRMIVWGGFSGEESPSRAALADGAAYDPTSDSWTMLPPAPFAGRALHAAVWTGGAMVVWGGTTSMSGLVADGASYDPATGSWTALPASPLAPRMSPTVVAAEGSMLVWGGLGDRGGALADGASLDPATGAWRSLPDSPLSGRAEHSAVWTESAMIVWGGTGGGAEDVSSDGAALRPGAGGGPATGPAAVPVTRSPVTQAPTTTSPPATALPSVLQCGDVGFAPDSDDVAGDIVAQGLSCPVAVAFVRTVAPTLGPVNGAARVEQDGFVCVRTSQDLSQLPTSTYECTNGTRRITFVRT